MADIGLLRSVHGHYEWQDECEFEGSVEHCVERLESLVATESALAARAAMVDVFGVVLGDEILDGCGVDRVVGPPILRLASDAQRRALVEEVCDRLSVHERTRTNSSRHTRATLKAQIARKNRSAYDEACRWLTRLREVCAATGAASEFEDYVADLRRRFNRRPALLDALRRARL